MSARPSFCALISLRARSRSTAYQNGLMLRTSTSIPRASISRRRSGPMMSARFSDGAPPIISLIPGISQCECTSTVLTRRPPTTTCRRSPVLAGCTPVVVTSPTPPPTTTIPAIALAVSPMKCLRVSICSSFRRPAFGFTPQLDRRLELLEVVALEAISDRLARSSCACIVAQQRCWSRARAHGNGYVVERRVARKRQAA